MYAISISYSGKKEKRHIAVPKKFFNTIQRLNATVQRLNAIVQRLNAIVPRVNHAIKDQR
jgi:hypothetical protein